MRIIILLVISLSLLVSNTFAGTVTLQWTVITDPAVTKVNTYHTNANNCASLVPRTPMIAPWTLIGSVTAPGNSYAFTENSGTWCYYATSANATDESVPSVSVSGVIPLGKPVLTITVSP